MLNGRPDVSSQVRERVLEAVKKNGFIPNNNARDLVRTRSDAIGIVVRGTDNVFFASMLKTINSEVSARGYDIVLHYISSNDDEIRAGSILEREKKLRGILFLGGRFDYSPDEVSLLNVPFVCCSYTNSFGSLSPEDYSSVSIDDMWTARCAVGKLIECGHREIAAFFDDIHDHSISELRYEGYRSALENAGIVPNPDLAVETGGFDMEHAYKAMISLLGSGLNFSAAFVESDTMAIGAMKALTDNGIDIPEACSVISIDGLKLSEYYTPTLSTMVQPRDEMARESVRILCNMIEGKGTEHVRPEAIFRNGGSLKKILL